MKEIKAIIQPFMLERVLDALSAYGELPGLTISRVQGWGRDRGSTGGPIVGGHGLAEECKLEIVVHDDVADEIAGVIARAAHTGQPSDGKIFVSHVADVIRIQTGARGHGAV